MTNYLITRRPRKIAPVSLLPGQHRASAEVLLHRLRPIIGEPVFDPDVDLESSWEELLRLDAGLRTFPADSTWLAERDHTGISLPRALRGDAPPTRFDVHWGPDAGSVRLGHQSDDKVFDYWKYEAFAKASGREMVVCGYGLDGDPRDVAVVGERLGNLSAEPGRIFVKGTGTKMFAGAARIHRSHGYSMLVFDNEFLDAGLWRYEGSTDCMLAQPYVPMADEYRFFVVGGKLVAGSAKVEEFLPFENTMAFDEFFKVDGNLVGRPELVEAYKGFAQQLAADLWQEAPALHNYTLDVATGPGGPLAVELNTMGASGLFRVDPMDVAKGFLP